MYRSEAAPQGAATFSPEDLMSYRKQEAERRMASYDALSPSTRDILKEHPYDPRPFGAL